MRNVKDNSAYLHHIKDASQKIIDYVSKHDLNAFEKNEWDQDAVMRNLEIIGEATNNIEDSFLKKYPEIPWRTIVNLRNILIHDYVNADLKIIWRIITNDLPVFYKQIIEIINS